MTEPLLQVYSPTDPHTEGWILGNKEGLLALRDALDLALMNDERSSAAEAAAVDGEGYKLLVVVTSSEELDQKDIVLPYSNAIYHAKQSRRHPIVLIGPSRYRELLVPPEEG